VLDIDPAYTVGEWALRRRAVLSRLEQEGVLELNKELEWPRLPQRLAVISSPTAAGLEDFRHQLQHNSGGFVIYTCLFPALMQGAQAESSILEALDRVLEHQELFDLVVLIRGGGATVDLSCFDGYELASALAQFPLPLLSGIGHERDRSVADMVAHTSVKTPTAAAELILSCLEQEDRKIEDMAASLLDMGQEAISAGVRQLQFYKERIVQLSSVQKNRGQLQIQKIESELRWAAREHLQQRKHRLDAAVQTIGLLSPQILARQLQRLDVLKLKLEAYSPELQLKRGFSITLHQGRILRSAGGLPPGSLLETRLEDGRVFSKTIQKQT
jgi:exodeoxyribonuclease VII large subunit